MYYKKNNVDLIEVNLNEIYLYSITKHFE